MICLQNGLTSFLTYNNNVVLVVINVNKCTRRHVSLHSHFPFLPNQQMRFLTHFRLMLLTEVQSCFLQLGTNLDRVTLYFCYYEKSSYRRDIQC